MDYFQFTWFTYSSGFVSSTRRIYNPSPKMDSLAMLENLAELNQLILRLTRVYHTN